MRPRHLMSIRIADARLLAATPVRRVALLGQLDGWRAALESVGIEVVDVRPDLVIAEPRQARRAAELGGATVILLGSRRRALRRAGYATRRVLVRQGAAGPRLFVPLDARAGAAHALLAPIPRKARLRRAAGRIALTALRWGAPSPGTITLATAGRQPPRLLAEALHAGLESAAGWYLVTGEGDDLQRVVWFCFGLSRARPDWVVKCSRVPGNDGPFEREEASLSNLDALPPNMRRHAPQLLGRFEVDGLPASVETAAPGSTLNTLLSRQTPDPLGLIGSIADWIVAVGRATQLPPETLRQELERLDTAVVPAWSADGAPQGLAASIRPIPAVLQHNDLGSWNILTDRQTFVVVDWESSCRAGLPLWDLVYFLTDALGFLGSPSGGGPTTDASLALLRGDLDTSAFLFDRVRNAAAALKVQSDAIGPIVTLGWLHHGLSATARAASGAAHGAATGRPSATGHLQQLAQPWLSDPALGVTWAALRATDA